MATDPTPDDVDLVVVGSGAAGLSAAVTAAWLGLDVVVVEKAAQIGGTSAWSGGWMWVPRNHLAVAAGIQEEIDAPRTYLKAELGDGYDETMAMRFLEQAPRMVRFFADQTALQFIDGNAIPDFHDTSPGSASGGRSVCAAPFDARRLGTRLRDLAPPLDLVSPFGMGIASGADLRHFLNATRRLASFLHVAKRLTRHVLDLVLHGRGMALFNGNALIAALLKSADDLGVTILTGKPVTGLIKEDGRVCGVVAGDTEIRARRGVVLASGGFPHDPQRLAALLPSASDGRAHWSAAPRTNTGDGLRMAEQVGGQVRTDLPNAAAWAPVSLVPRANGEAGHFPHLIERAKPGLVMVRRNGRRFGNEANSYHDLMQALFRATPEGEMPECWMICDSRFIRRFGLGAVRPFPVPHVPALHSGYLKRGQTLAELARASGIDAAGLEDEIRRYNDHARTGSDPAFGRGSSLYNRVQGDAEVAPNPCVAPVLQAPFFAVRIVTGSLGTFAGVKTDADARVLDAHDNPLPGLYAVGNDMSSMMAGRYPAGGITLGPGMTFGFIAAHHAAGVPLANNRNPASP